MEIGLLIGGVIFGLIGAALLWQQLEALLFFKRLDGKVVAIEKRTTPPSGNKGRGGPMYYPVVEYIARGNKRTFTGSTGYGQAAHRIGDSVRVLYSHKKGEARLKSVLPLVLGLIFFAIGAGLCVAFVNTFSFSPFSMGASAVMGVFLLYQARKGLKKRDISTIDEFKESFRNTEMKTAKGTAPEQKVLLSTPEEVVAERKSKSKAQKYVGPVFALAGIAVLALGIYLGMQRYDFLEIARPADGEVVELNERRSDDSYVYYPVVEFQLPGSYEVLTFEHDTGSNPPSYSVGERVTVLYDPGDPRNAIIDGGIWNWFGAGLASLLGLLFTVTGIASGIQQLKFRKANS